MNYKNSAKKQNKFTKYILMVSFSLISIFIFFSDHPILQILESRTGDRLATEFVKKQKQRFAIK